MAPEIETPPPLDKFKRSTNGFPTQMADDFLSSLPLLAVFLGWRRGYHEGESPLSRGSVGAKVWLNDDLDIGVDNGILV